MRAWSPLRGYTARLVVASLLIGARAHPQNTTAALMYDEGRKAMRVADYERACSAFQESLRLESNPGAVYSLAECEDRRGRLATSSALYAEYVRRVALMEPEQAARHETFRASSVARLEALRPLVPSVLLRVPDGGPFEVRLDELRLSEALRASSVPLDPGTHTWTLRSSGGESRDQFVIREGEHLEIETRAPVASPPVVSSSPVVLPPPSASAPVARSSWPTTTLVAGGIGLTATAVGLVAAGVAVGYRVKLGNDCPGRVCQGDQADSLRTARHAASVSTVSLAIGAVGLVTASVAWWLGRPGPSTASASVAVSPSGAQVFWQRAW